MGNDLEAVCSFPASKCPSPAIGTNAAMSTFYCPLSCPACDTLTSVFTFPVGRGQGLHRVKLKLCRKSKQ